MAELTKIEAVAFFAELYFGEHHIPARGCCGAHGVKEWSPGSYYVNHYGDMATYDYDFLTRLVFLAHDKCFRASVQNSGPRMIKIIIFKRDRNTTSMYERHPTIEGALAAWRKRHPAEIGGTPLSAAQATIAALQWTPITPENLPKVGDAVAYFIYPPSFPSGYCADVQIVCVDWNILPWWHESRFTHFLHISPPAQASATDLDAVAAEQQAELAEKAEWMRRTAVYEEEKIDWTEVAQEAAREHTR